MSEHLIALLLGVVQGLTEFLPVSSSGHLELVKFMTGDDAIGSQGLLMTVVLHFGTALATILVFRRDIADIAKGIFRRDADAIGFAAKIAVSMLPAVLVGVVFEKEIEQLFSQNIVLVSSMLLVTAVLLFLADHAKGTDRNVSYSNAWMIGMAQAVAILPGISRSGATISAATLLKVDREKAARFSFLMVIPLIAGKMIKDAAEGDLTAESVHLSELGIGFFAALITGYFACQWMIALVKKAKLSYFSYYCLLVGSIGLAYSLL